MMEQRCDGPIRRVRHGIAVSFAILLPAAAEAAELKFPPSKPAVSLEVPDDWKIDTANGLDMRSSDKKAIVVADVLRGDKAKLQAWANGAASKLKAFGVAFDPKAKAPPKAGDGASSAGALSAFSKSPGGAFTFSGKPSLATPGTTGSNDPVKFGPTSLEALTGTIGSTQPASGPMPKLPFHAVQYYGTTLNGRPVDVQLVIYSLPEKRLFVMMQESAPDDGRTVAIAQSIRGIRTAKSTP